MDGGQSAADVAPAPHRIDFVVSQMPIQRLSPDRDRLRALADAPASDALSQFPDQVVMHSRDLGWKNLLVWHQRGEVRELYVPPISQHALLLRLGRPTATVQMRVVNGDAPERPEASRRQAYWACGEMAIVPAGEASYWANEAGSDNLHIHVEPDLLLRMAEANGSSAAGPVMLRSCGVVHDQRLRLIGEALLDVLEHPGFGDRLFVEGIGHALAAHLLSRYTDVERPRLMPPRMSPTQLQAIEAFVEGNLDQPLTLDRLATTAGLSLWHFARCFKQATGMSPHRYVTERRLRRSLALLKGTKRPLTEIAFELGFSDAAHFSRVFKSHFGASPRDYRLGR